MDVLSCLCSLEQLTPLESCAHALALAHAEAEEVARLTPSPYAEGYAAGLSHAIEICSECAQNGSFEK